VYFLASTLVVFLTALGSVGTEKLATRDVSARQARKESLTSVVPRLLLTTSLGSMIVGGGFLLGIPWMSQYLFSDVPLETVAGFLAVWIVLHAIEKTLAGIFRGKFDLRRSALLSGVLARAGFLLSFLGVAWWGERTIGAALTVQVAAVAGSVGYGLWVMGSQIGLGQAWDALRGVPGLVNKGIPFAATALLYLSTSKLDILLVGGLLTADDVAIYTTAAKLAAVTGIPLAVVNSVVQPAVSELFAQDDYESLVSLTRGTSTLAVGLSLSALLILVVGGRRILGLMFGSYYVQAYPILVALTLRKVIDVGMGSGGMVLMMTGRENATLLIVTLSAFLMLGLGAGLGILFGRMGISIAVVLSTLVQNLLMVGTIRRSLGIWVQASLDPSCALEILGFTGEDHFKD